MIVVIQQGSERALFHCTNIVEKRKPSGRKVVNLYNDGGLIEDGGDIDPTNTAIHIMPDIEEN